MTSRSLGHRAPLLWLVLPLIAGLAVGENKARDFWIHSFRLCLATGLTDKCPILDALGFTIFSISWPQWTAKSLYVMCCSGGTPSFSHANALARSVKTSTCPAFTMPR